MSGAERLREAARVLRERAEAATPEPWATAGVRDQGFAVHRGEHDTIALYAMRDDATYIATMHPGVGLALADWLGHEAYRVSRVIDGGTGRTWHVADPSALAVADAILGGAL